MLLKRQIQCCDFLYHSPERAFKSWWDRELQQSSHKTVHSVLIDALPSLVSACSFCISQPAITGRARGSPAVACCWFQFPTSTTDTSDATSKTSLCLEQMDTQMIPRREEQARLGQCQVEEDNVLRSQPRHQPFLHWKFLPFISLHCVPSLTGLLIHLGPSNIKRYSACCEIILCLSSSDLEIICHHSGLFQTWTHHLLINKTSNSAKQGRREACLFAEKHRTLQVILTFSWLPEPSITSTVRIPYRTKTYSWPGVVSLEQAWLARTTIRSWLPVSGRPWLLNNLTTELRAKRWSTVAEHSICKSFQNEGWVAQNHYLRNNTPSPPQKKKKTKEKVL